MKQDFTNSFGNVEASDWFLSEQALKSLYIQNFDVVKRYVMANNGDEDDAKDIYQETFVAFWRNVQLGKFENLHEGSITAYILQIAKFKWIDVLRKNKMTTIESDLAEIIEDEETELTNQYLDRIVQAFTKMEDPCKSLLHKFYYLKLKLKEIALFFSWTEATAKNNKYRCLQKLRALVQEQ